jgi:GntR family transcriptional regulator
MRKAPLDALAREVPMVVDPRSLPEQLSERIRQMIEDGSFPGGSQLPTEKRLAEHFRIGRTTVREALKQLEHEGVVVVRRGRGRFVSSAPKLHRPITRLESVTVMLASQGYSVENRLLSTNRRPASPDERLHLRLEPDSTVLRLERLRLHRGDPLIYSVDVLPGHIIGPQERDWSGSLFDFLAERELVPVMSVTTIRAAQLPPSAAAACGVDPTQAWLLMVQLNLAADDTPVIYSHDYHRGDRFSFDLLRRAEEGRRQ